MLQHVCLFYHEKKFFNLAIFQAKEIKSIQYFRHMSVCFMMKNVF